MRDDMNQKRLDAAMEACRKKAREFHIEGFRFHRNFGGIKGNRVVEAYGEGSKAETIVAGDYATYAEY